MSSATSTPCCRCSASRGGTVIRIAIGVAVFLVPQVVLFLVTPAREGIADPGWFLNSGRNVAAIAGAVGVAAAVLAAGPGWKTRDAVMLGIGVVCGMAATLFTIGP